MVFVFCFGVKFLEVFNVVRNFNFYQSETVYLIQCRFRFMFNDGYLNSKIRTVTDIFYVKKIEFSCRLFQ